MLGAVGYNYFADNGGGIKDSINQVRKETGTADAIGLSQASAVGNTAFKGNGQGFISLKLESVETVNDNTKKLRFQLPEKDQVSGLRVASALLTKYQAPDMEKPVIRPYTPVSDEGSSSLAILQCCADLLQGMLDTLTCS
jgi:cytochrome-b5 reductase